MYVLISLNILAFVIPLFTFTVVDDNEIIKYSMLSPSGKSYSLADVDKINMGFDKDGELYYNVVINEKKINLVFDAYETSEENLETYEEYLHIDKRIFELNPSVKKDGSMKRIDKCDYGYETVNKLKDIIEYNG